MGRGAERLAAFLLRFKGFSVLAHRFKAPVGEIDLVLRRGRLIVFVEVKARGSLDLATEAVSATARRRIEAAANAFIARHPHLAQMDMRYDIFAVAGWRTRHIPGAWLARA